MYVPMYNGKTVTPIYIPHHHNYSTSTGDVRDICEPECSVGDYLIMGWALCIGIGVLVFLYCITKEVFK